MAFYAGVGVSRQLQDSFGAGRDAAHEAMKNMGAEKADIAVVFASSHYDQEAMLKGVREGMQGAAVIGCTSAGAITRDGVSEESVAVLAMKSDEGTFVPVKVTEIGKDMRAAGLAFGSQFKEVADPVTMGFIFSDALAGNGTELVRGVLDAMGRDFKLAGGAASDDMQFKKTYQYFNDEVLTNAAVGFGITGPMLIAAGAEHGWKPIGNPRIVTKAEGTKLIELDGKPAFEIYKDYFGERAGDFKQALTLAAVSYPLGMKAKGVEEIMVRVPLAVGEDGSIVCGAELIEGSEVSLMIGTLSSTLWAAEATAKAAMHGMEGAHKRVIFVSDCVARKILLGERGKEEIALLKTVGGENTEIFGFYSYGQIAPLKPPSENINTCDPGFYEQSISVTVCGF